MTDEITALRAETERLTAKLAKAEASAREQVAGAYLAAEERLAVEQGALITRRVISAINSLTPADAISALEARIQRERADERAKVIMEAQRIAALWRDNGGLANDGIPYVDESAHLHGVGIAEAIRSDIGDRHTDESRKAGGDA